MAARGREGERWWGRVPAVATVRQESMRAPLPWEIVRARLCEAAASGVLAEPASRPVATPLYSKAQR
jgi:hypothetical protein